MEVEHNQKLNKSQNDFVTSIKWSFKEQRGAELNKSKIIQMIIDKVKIMGIKPEEFIK